MMLHTCPERNKFISEVFPKDATELAYAGRALDRQGDKGLLRWSDGQPVNESGQSLDVDGDQVGDVSIDRYRKGDLAGSGKRAGNEHVDLI